ncbi:class I SAM-dependent methyltransferase [Brytella acorum]|uniref:S-adenosyl-L-methionine-dependent methyltransferase n=1 Tax=Brytella acorum TaxID=2959299 RepID=A0AA35USY9_9PROT|nr:class I SAM-dependent methyltransferase [Brytella acorum]MDF3625853.1 class I SAM-dependent methyltransferase [Brytella acorum]CAI9121593.1 class I SAM-dependent methyltransferase [Brytella acorum]
MNTITTPCPDRMAWDVARHQARHHLLAADGAPHDALALRLLGAEALELSGEPDRLPHEAAMRGFIAARNRFAEERLARAIAGGTHQAVILGAGLNTLGFRPPYASSEVKIFEVDQPEMQAWKRARLAEIGAEVPQNLAFVSLDLDHDGLLPSLEAVGFNPMRPVFFVVLGLVPHLTYEMNDAIMRFISSLPRGEMVFDYLEPPANSAPDTRGVFETRGVDGRPACYFDARGMEDIMELTNFRWFEDLDRADMLAMFELPVQPWPGTPKAHVIHARA